MKKIQPKAILFDMDGVLIDSLEAWWISLNTALAKYNYKKISKNEFIKRYWGHDLFDNLKSMNIPYKVGTFCNNIYYENVNRIKIYQDTKYVLDKLKHYKKSIITNTPKDCTIQILKKFEIAKYFNLVLTSSDVKTAKPSPEIVFKTCIRLGVNPEDVVLVGDTNSDVESGKAAGCNVIGIKVEADYTIDNIKQLLDIIEIKNI